MSKITKQEVFSEGDSLIDYPIDVNMGGEQESNGSTEHIIFHKNDFYRLQVGWEEDLGRMSKINLKEELKENEDGEIAKYIKENKIKVK